MKLEGLKRKVPNGADGHKPSTDWINAGDGLTHYPGFHRLPDGVMGSRVWMLARSGAAANEGPDCKTTSAAEKSYPPIDLDISVAFGSNLRKRMGF
jgi:hypothetical protein